MLTIKEAIAEAGIKFPLDGYILAQAAHETGNFSSAIFLGNKNLFGMKYAGQSLATGESRGHATYNSYQDSVNDLVKWLNRRASWIVTWPNLLSLAGYVKILKDNNYFEAPESEYWKGCSYWYRILVSNE